MDISSSNTRPDLPAGRGSWLDRLIARRLQNALKDTKDLALRVTLPSGYKFRCGSPTVADALDWQIRSWNAIWRIISSGSLGFAEGYVNQEWDSADLQTLLTRFAVELDGIAPAHGKSGPSRILGRFQHRRNANSKSGSKRNISFHYDLGNSFYETWLDNSMTYSSALFEAYDEPLEVAQTRKYRRICEALQLKPGQRVLEIGCGWGGFAEVAIRDFGCHVTGVTLSREQLEFAQARLEGKGLSGQADLRFQDYRDVTGRFDAIASVEMFEAVGEEHWDIYFRKLEALLVPGGRSALQIITIRDRDFEGYRSNVDFIQKYVFPGGMLPTDGHLDRLADEAGLTSIGQHMFRHDYAETLRRWHRDFLAAWTRIEPLGFDDRFYRIWRYYLAYCEAGFDAGRIDVGQFTYQKPG